MIWRRRFAGFQIEELIHGKDGLRVPVEEMHRKREGLRGRKEERGRGKRENRESVYLDLIPF